jgi:hypothetical protein
MTDLEHDSRRIFFQHISIALASSIPVIFSGTNPVASIGCVVVTLLAFFTMLIRLSRVGAFK